MSASEDSESGERADAGPRAILRVPEVLIAVATRRGGASLAELGQVLGLPKTSLHRLLRTLEHGGYLVREGGRYAPGPESFRLGRLLGQAATSDDFPASARPVLESLARESGETVMLTVLSDRGHEIVYVDVIESEAPLRFTLRPGNRRPLYAVASGKVMLAFLPAEAQADYLAQAEFVRFTADTTRREEMPQVLQAARESAVVFDQNGIVDGAAGIASAAFDAEGRVFCSVSVAGPTDRVRAHRTALEAQVLAAGERISRVLGYDGVYPPPFIGAQST